MSSGDVLDRAALATVTGGFRLPRWRWLVSRDEALKRALNFRGLAAEAGTEARLTGNRDLEAIAEHRRWVSDLWAAQARARLWITRGFMERPQ